MNLIERIILKKSRENNWQKKFEDFKPGDTLKVFVKVKEGEKERLQLFRGVVVKIQGSGLGRSFTVRKISSGVGVERTFPFASLKLDKIEVVSRGNVRRSRLYYLRNLSGRAARLDSELVIPEGGSQAAETAGAEGTAADTAPVEKKAKKNKSEDKKA